MFRKLSDEDYKLFYFVYYDKSCSLL